MSGGDVDLPLFPLSAVLVPGGRMPLRIFERRYLDLVRDCMRSGDSFGVVWIRRGSEVARQGLPGPELGAYGTTALIVDWDQLPEGLLGITVQGGDRFDLAATRVRPDGLLVGRVAPRPAPPAQPLQPAWQSLREVLAGLATHPHVARLGMHPDLDDAWQVAFALVQLLPLEESLKYELLGLQDLAALMGNLERAINRMADGA